MLVFVRKIRSTTHSNAFFLTLWHKVPLDAQNAPKSNRHWQSTCYKAAFRNSLLWLYQHSTSTSQYKHSSSVKTPCFSPRRNVARKSMQRGASAYATWSISRHLTARPPEDLPGSQNRVKIFRAFAVGQATPLTPSLGGEGNRGWTTLLIGRLVRRRLVCGQSHRRDTC